jgi:hypothetical protein
MSHQPSSLAPLSVAVLLALPLLYVGSYFALMQRQGYTRLDGRCQRGCVYRVPGKVPKTIYAPANWTDRHVRPAYWDPHVGR